MRPHFNSNDDLVDYLVNQMYIESDRVETAFRNVDRARFVPEEMIGDAYTDRPLSIGEEATISAPHMVAISTELLEPGRDQRILEIGSGSGYQLAILAELADEVVGVEILPRLVEKSRERLEGRENVEIFQGSGFEPVEGDFDRILYSCGIDSFRKAVPRLRQEGVIVAPINEDGGQVLRRYRDGEVTEHSHVSFVRFRED